MPNATPVSGPYSYTTPTYHQYPLFTVVSQLNSPALFSNAVGLVVTDNTGVQITGSNGQMFPGSYLKNLGTSTPAYYAIPVYRVNVTSGSSGIVIVSHFDNRT